MNAASRATGKVSPGARARARILLVLQSHNHLFTLQRTERNTA